MSRLHPCNNTENYVIKVENLAFTQFKRSQFQITGKIIILENITESLGVCYLNNCVQKALSQSILKKKSFRQILNTKENFIIGH